MLKIDVLVAKTEINSFGKVIKINVPSTITLPEIIIEADYGNNDLLQSHERDKEKGL